MIATDTPVATPAISLVYGDRFQYDGTSVEVMGLATLGDTIVEVEVDDALRGMRRFIDHGVDEIVLVTAGPSWEQGRAPKPEPVRESATSRATSALLARNALSGHPATIRLVLLALAALEDRDGMAVSPASVAAVAGLSEGTVKGYLSTLYQKGLVRRGNAWAGYTVA